MSNISRRDNDNLRQFHDVVKRAYEVAKKAGNIVANDISVYDKLIAAPSIVYPTQYSDESFRNRPIQARRIWRRRVVRMYRLQEGGPLRGLFGFDFNIDWEKIQKWILENIVPILKSLLMIIPFII